MLTLSDVKVGTPRPPRSYNNRPVPSHYETFISDLSDGKTTYEYAESGMDYKTIVTAPLIYRVDNIEGNDLYHNNYMTYLEKCWADHLGAVMTPDILWYTILCEITSMVASDPEYYRSLFSTSQETQDIAIETGDRVVMPLTDLVEALAGRVPSDVDLFVPRFSTTNERSQHAFYAAFADMCSPYYNYMMYCCGIPYIDVRGEWEDYNRISNSLRGIAEIFPHEAQLWLNSTLRLCTTIENNLEEADFWRNMFVLERCGSGSQVEVGGWFAKIFREQPKGPRFPENFATHISKVNYKDLPTDKNYVMKVGLLASNMQGDLLVPDFGHIVYEKVNNE